MIWTSEITTGHQQHAVSSDRPVNLSLPTLFLHMPVTAVASILHRLTGVVLFVGVVYLFYLLELALTGDAGFAEAARLVSTPLGKFALWAVIASLAFHFIAGVRHLLLDLHVGDSLAGGRVGAWLSIALGVAAAVAAGVWLW